MRRRSFSSPPAKVIVVRLRERNEIGMNIRLNENNHSTQCFHLNFELTQFQVVFFGLVSVVAAGVLSPIKIMRQTSETSDDGSYAFRYNSNHRRCLQRSLMPCPLRWLQLRNSQRNRSRRERTDETDHPRCGRKHGQRNVLVHLSRRCFRRNALDGR